MKGLMKLIALAVLALGFCGAASAQTTQTLPTTMNAPWGAVTVQAAVTGFTADGNYVTGHSRGYIAHGHSGKGATITYLYYCRDWTWDLSGKVVGFTDYGTNVYATYSKCPLMNAGGFFTIAAGYEAYTADLSPSDQYGVIDSPILVSP